MAQATIATWFVADDHADATFFPQVGARSDSPAAQAAYWRCTAVFFASSLVHNPAARHVFYTNTRVPRVDGVDIAALLARWGVETVHLPIATRLPRGSVSAWGNQFYVFNAMAHHAATGGDGALILLDSDCLWRRSADALLAALARHGALTYDLGADEHPEGEPINGQTREGLARFLAAKGGPELARVAYCGGEFYAADAPTNRALSASAQALWPAVLEQGPDAPREEAHLLSVLYARQGIAIGTGNAFIRRMWTTFRHNNLRGSDRDLAIWHLPAEKRTGFADLFARIAANPEPDPAALDLTGDATARAMGFPRRSPRKFARDLALKLAEKLRR